jgi:DNA-binding transcriptional LysR family regulator
VELRHLRYFVAVAEALNFRRAADTVRVAQPALSKQIKDLEEQVGARLFDRNTGGVALTDAGTIFLEEARDILERVDMAVKAAREAQSGRSGRLTVGSLGAVSASFLPATLAAFRKEYPAVEINLHEAPAPEQIHALQSGVIQVGFTIDRAVARSATLASTEVATARFAIALGRQHRLAAEPRVALADLADETFYCLGGTERHQLHLRLMENIFAARGVRHRPIKRVNGLESLVALVTGGHGVSLLLPFLPASGTDELVFRPLMEDGDDLIVHILAVWSNRSRSHLIRNFIDVVRRQARTVRAAPTQRRAAAHHRQPGNRTPATRLRPLSE